MCQPWGGGLRKRSPFFGGCFLAWAGSSGDQPCLTRAGLEGRVRISSTDPCWAKGKTRSGPGVKRWPGFCSLQCVHQVAPSSHESASSGLSGAWGLPQSSPLSPTVHTLPPGPGELRRTEAPVSRRVRGRGGGGFGGAVLMAHEFGPAVTPAEAAWAPGAPSSATC